MKLNTEKSGLAMRFYLVERFFYVHHLEILARLIFRFMQLLLGCTIPYTVKIDREVKIPHWHGIVMFYKSEIGKGTKVYQNVTLAGGRNGDGPIIGDNCILGAGCVLLGNVKIGNNVNVGANAVVLSDVPDNCTVVGIPAQIVKNRNII